MSSSYDTADDLARFILDSYEDGEIAREVMESRPAFEVYWPAFLEAAGVLCPDLEASFQEHVVDQVPVAVRMVRDPFARKGEVTGVWTAGADDCALAARWLADNGLLPADRARAAALVWILVEAALGLASWPQDFVPLGQSFKAIFEWGVEFGEIDASQPWSFARFALRFAYRRTYQDAVEFLQFVEAQPGQAGEVGPIDWANEDVDFRPYIEDRLELQRAAAAGPGYNPLTEDFEEAAARWREYARRMEEAAARIERPHTVRAARRDHDDSGQSDVDRKAEAERIAAGKAPSEAAKKAVKYNPKRDRRFTSTIQRDARIAARSLLLDETVSQIAAKEKVSASTVRRRLPKFKHGLGLKVAPGRPRKKGRTNPPTG